MAFGFSVDASEKNNQVLIYKGETKHWAIISKVTIVGNTVDHIDTVKYKGKNIDSVGKITYHLQSIAGSSGGTTELADNSKSGEPGTIIGRGGGGNIELINKVTTVIAHVEWNDKVERFELKRQ
jgi:hypothetical protein